MEGGLEPARGLSPALDFGHFSGFVIGVECSERGEIVQPEGVTPDFGALGPVCQSRKGTYDGHS